MKVILLEDIKNVGTKGTVLEVGDGYALNFLIPNKKVIEYKSNSGKELYTQTKKNIENKIKTKSEQDKNFSNIPDSIEVSAEVNENNKPFTSLNKNAVLNVLLEKGCKVDKKWIEFNPIKELGEYNILLKNGNAEKNLKVNFKPK